MEERVNLPERITVVMRDPRKPYIAGPVENELEAFQHLVGGYIETLKICKDVLLVIDEEGKLKGDEINFAIGRGMARDLIAGTAVFTGIDEGEFVSCPYRAHEIAELIGGHRTELPDLTRTGMEILKGEKEA